MRIARRGTVVTRWLRANPTTRVGAPAVALLLGISGLFGGLDRVPLTDRVDEVAPGAEVALQPYELTLKRAVAIDELDGVIRPAGPGNYLMVVLMDAENVSKESTGSALLTPVPQAKSFRNSSLVVLDDRLAPERPSIYDADSNSVVSLLNPGLTYRLAVVWELSGAVPRQLPLMLRTLTLRGLTISPDVLEWQDPEVAATMTLPVQDRTKGPA